MPNMPLALIPVLILVTP